MKKTQTIQLIEGKFSSQEAKNIIAESISHKINFHNLRNLSSEMRYGKPDEPSVKRREELKATLIKYTSFIDQVKDKQISIEYNIQLTVED